MATDVGLKTPVEVVNRVVNKIVLLLTTWPADLRISGKAVGPEGLFWSLATGKIFFSQL